MLHVFLLSETGLARSAGETAHLALQPRLSEARR